MAVSFDAGRSPAIGGDPGALFQTFRQRAILVGTAEIEILTAPDGTLFLAIGGEPLVIQDGADLLLLTVSDA